MAFLKPQKVFLLTFLAGFSFLFLSPSQSEANQPPVARINITSTEVPMNTPVQFSVEASDPDGTLGYPVFAWAGNNSLIKYIWSFGDDVPAGLKVFSQSPQHTYALPGMYELRVTVYDNEGASTEDVVILTVVEPEPVPPVIDSLTVDDVVVEEAATVRVYDEVQFSIEASDPDGTIESYAWNFGDGIEQSATNPSHTYSVPGDYDLQVSVYDNDGNETRLTRTIHVEDPVGGGVISATSLELDPTQNHTSRSLEMDSYPGKAEFGQAVPLAMRSLKWRKKKQGYVLKVTAKAQGWNLMEEESTLSENRIKFRWKVTDSSGQEVRGAEFLGRRRSLSPTELTSQARILIREPGVYQVTATPVVNRKENTQLELGGELNVIDVAMDDVDFQFILNNQDECPDGKIFWVGRQYVAYAITVPWEFSSLVEWSSEEQYLHRGFDHILAYNEGKMTNLAVSLGERRIDEPIVALDTIMVDIPTDVRQTLNGNVSTCTARTIPEGHEHDIHWAVDTMHGMGGTVTPETAEGGEFTAAWNLKMLGTQSNPYVWFMLSANEEFFGGDLPVPQCGDGNIDPGEQCDGSNLNGQTCISQGFDGGTLACDGSCNLDTSSCYECGDGNVDPGEQCDDGNMDNTDDCLNTCINPFCGDGFVWAGNEECDSSNLDGETCMSQGFDGGVLQCDIEVCLFDTSLCFKCGNGEIESGEECDGLNLNGETCMSQGFDGGPLVCDGMCMFDTSGCTECGNGNVEMGEECDGADLNGETCVSQGFEGGTLSCNGMCMLDTSDCNDCGNGSIDPGEACDGSDLNGETCVSQGFDGGTLSCDGSCSLDTSSCYKCGDGNVDPGEQCDDGNMDNTDDCPDTCMNAFCGDGFVWAGNEDCDGANLNSKTCQSLGFDEGTLSCFANCFFDTNMCVSNGGGGYDEIITGINDGDFISEDEEETPPQSSSLQPVFAIDCYPEQTCSSGQEVLLHTGQEFREVVDFTLKGRETDLDVVVKRRHVSRNFYPDSMFGDAWAFNYQQIITEQPGGDLLLESYERKDTYLNIDATHWEGQAERFELIRYEAATATTGNFIMRYPQGLEFTYASEGAAGSRVAHLVKIETPNMNSIQFEYEPTGPIPQRKLLKIIDSYGRDIDFAYGGDDLLDSITDFSGRFVTYTYDTAYSSRCELLTERASPAVNDTGGLGIDNFPSGKRERYGYYIQENPADPAAVLDEVGCSIVSLIRPNEVEDASLLEMGRWVYDTNPASKSFGFVLSETIGNTGAAAQTAGIDAGGTFSYVWNAIDTASPGYAAVAGTVNAPIMSVTMTDRRGFEHKYHVNELGYITQEEIKENGTLSYFQNHRYNDNLKEITFYKETTAQNDSTYESEVIGTQRLSEGNRTTSSLSPDDRGGDQAQIEEMYVYEPVFNKVFQHTDPRGLVTTYHYDYMEDLSAAATFFAPKLNRTAGNLLTEFAAKGIVDLADVNGDGVTNQFKGNLIQTVYPTVTLPSETTEFGILPSTTQNASETWAYNGAGQLVEHVDPEGNIFQYIYFHPDDPDGDGFDLSGAPYGGPDEGEGGYLKEVINDAGGVDQTIAYTYLGGGIRGIPTKVTDPRGVEMTMIVNVLDQIIQTTLADSLAAGADPNIAGGVLDYRTQVRYDANDNMIAERIEDIDPVNGPASPGTFIVHTTLYDILDNKVREEREVSTAPLKQIINTYEYDEDELLVKETMGLGSPEESVKELSYTAQELIFKETEGLGSSEESTTEFRYDRSRFLVETIDAEGDNIIENNKDGYGRYIGTEDRVGNRSEVTYDPSGNPVEVKNFGPATSGGPEVLLSHTVTHYDERNRADIIHRKIFHSAGLEVGTINEGGTAGGNIDPSDGNVTEVIVRDRLSRTVGMVDDEEDVVLLEYDGLSRNTKITDPAGNVTTMTYDAADNLVQAEKNEVASAGGLITAAETFISNYTYDALNRTVDSIEPNGQTTTNTYDSRNNTVRLTDELGNEVENDFDNMGRPVESRTYLSSDGTSATSGNLDITQGGGDGIITKLIVWDDLSRMKSVTDDRGNSTTYTYDDLNRKIRTDYADGTFETEVFNDDSVVTTHTDQNGSVVSYTYDSENRLISVTVARAPGVIGTTSRTFEYDGLNRMIKATDDNGSGEDVVVEYIFDSLSRVIRESQTVGVRAALNVDIEYQGLARESSIVYPDGRGINQTHDALDRVFDIREDAGSGLIAQFDYVGPGRILRILYGNGTVLDKRNQSLTQTIGGVDPGYDNNGRDIRHAWKTSGGSPLTGYENTYNGPGGIGTNRSITEVREHLDHRDEYILDSSYRMREFKRDVTHSSGLGGINSTRTLDGVDKMTAFNDEGTNQNPSVDGVPAEAGMNQYDSFAGQGRTYDDEASLENDGTFKYSHDINDRVVEIRDAGDDSLIAQYLYAYDNRRVLRTVASDVTRYLYKGWNVVEERDDTDSILRQYVDAQGIDDHLQLKDVAGPDVYYYHTNHQGFVGALSDAGEAIVEYYEYSWLGRPKILDPDGTTVLPSSNVDNPYMFQGRRYDNETGHYYFRNRYYSPLTGEFLTIDPSGNWEHGQGNGFSAFGEDGWNNADPFGLWTKGDHKKLTEQSFETSKPKELSKDCNASILEWLKLWNVEQDEGKRFDDNSRHFNRPVDHNDKGKERGHTAQTWITKYSNYVNGELKAYNKLLDKHKKNLKKCTPGLLSDCRDALKSLGLINHSWQDYYAHVLTIRTAIFTGKKVADKMLWTATKPVTNRVPSSWNGILQPGEHGWGEVGGEEGKKRKASAVKYGSDEQAPMLKKWAETCKCCCSELGNPVKDDKYSIPAK